MSKRKQKPLTVGFIALGCPKNVVDSERMLAEIAQAGLIISSQADNVDVVIVNTCGFIEPAKQEAFEAIEQAVSWKHQSKVKKVIVTGCLSQRLGEELLDKIDGIDAVVGLGDRDQIVNIIGQSIKSDSPKVYLDHHCGSISEAEPKLSISDDRTRLLITPPHTAYLRISEGCDHKCSFCTIPAIRGRFRSKEPQMVVEEARQLVDSGVVELNIIAQDTTSYGRDLKQKNALAELLEQLEKIDGLEWIRLMYAYPTGINDRLIEVIAKSRRIVPYIDMPIQHINDQILTNMRRPDRHKSITAVIEKLRQAIPDIVLRTTVIVGFPGETDEQFRELLDFIEWARFDALGCFEFYPETGTEAAKMPDQIPEHIKQQRAEELMLTQQKIVFEKNTHQIGASLRCLVDSIEADKTAQARYHGQAPEIDSVCIIRNCSADQGEFVEVKVVETSDYDLVVEQI
ncbi:MAG: 30S ribosomal protein S12 methylthiotransferase RimO [Planctomycetota bacterium]|jgi:ribosomal protein S12 methylthiotransferase